MTVKKNVNGKEKNSENADLFDKLPVRIYNGKVKGILEDCGYAKRVRVWFKSL